MKFSRRQFTKIGAAVGGAMAFPWRFGPFGAQGVRAQIPGGSLPPGDVGKFALPLVKPPAMPGKFSRTKDKYRIAVRQFTQRILSPPHPETIVWSYGSADHPGTVAQGGTFNYPAFTIEARANRATQVQWRNELVDGMGNYLPHILPVDQTVHWANPPGGLAGRDTRGTAQDPYMGPVPIITHVHGAHTMEDSDGYPEAWFLPDANNIPAGYATTGTFYDHFNTTYSHNWSPGTGTFKYPNDQPATTLWYHDHALGMTRLNVYAGPAGYWLIRGGPNDANLGYVAPGVGDDPLGEYTEIPIVIQDRSFNADGSLFYPDNRAFFEGVNPSQLQIPFIPDPACDGKPSDISPIWNPEFFGNMMVVNGFTWPYLEVEKRRYRFRFLNGCNSRFLLLKMTKTPRMHNAGFNTPEHNFLQIGADQGFLPGAVSQSQLLMAPAERADVIVDFSGFAVGDAVYLVNDGPDAPFGGIGVEDISDWESTGLVMKFIVKARTSPDTSVVPTTLPAPAALGASSATQFLTLNEEESATVRTSESGGNTVLDCASGEPFAPKAALLGTSAGGAMLWGDPVTEVPQVGATETWELRNFTEDAHPIHVHLVKFKVLGRQPFAGGTSIVGTNGPLPSETGYKDTVIAYPGETTRIKAKFDIAGQFVWHCHIVEHEDNEMMRPFRVGAPMA